MKIHRRYISSFLLALHYKGCTIKEFIFFIFRYPRTKKIGFKTHRDTSFIDDLGKWKRVSFKARSIVTVHGKTIIDLVL